MINRLELWQKKQLAETLNNHGLLDKYDSIEILEILCWEIFVKQLIEYKISLETNWVYWLALDIDETLSDTSLFWFEKILDLFWNPENLTPKEMYIKYHLCQNVPYWQNREDVQDWMHKHREDDDFQLMIPLIEWTEKTYSDIHENIIPIVAYITVRPDSIQAGTRKWLETYNFPPAKQIFRPQQLEHGIWNLWKACVLDILSPNIVGIVDDNPNLIKMLPKRYNWHVFLFSHPSISYNHINVHASPTVDHVRNNIKKVFYK